MKDDAILKTAFRMYFDENHPYDPKAEQKLSWKFTVQYHFEEKMDKLISNQKHSYWKYVNTVGKQVAIVFIVITIIFSTAMTVDAFRKPVVEFVIKTYEKFSYFLVGENTSTDINEFLSEEIKIQMYPQELPDDFTVSEHFNNDYLCIMVWKNKINEYIKFYQCTASTAFSINTENVDLHKRYIDNLVVYYYSQNNVTSYAWYKDGYAFSLNTTKDLTFEQIENIIKSVK